MNRFKTFKMAAGCFLAASMMTGCQTEFQIASIEGGHLPVTDRLDAEPDSAATAILAPYCHVVDSIMSPLVGHSARLMDRYRPESPLSNLVADILREAAAPKVGHVADVAVTNMGGLRSSLPEGDITFGNIYEITPFENYLTLIRMKGSVLREVLMDIAAVGGEGLSGARMVITKGGKLVSAEVGGQPIDDERVYLLSTIDYLAEGNDRMYTFGRVPLDDKLMYPETTLRELFLNYVADKETQGQPVDAREEGRITVAGE